MAEREKLQNYMGIILLPLLIIHVIKCVMGVRWIVKRFRRTAMQSYFILSISYYAAFCVQVGYLLIFTWDVFDNRLRGIFIYSIVICIPLAILVTIYMKYLDRQ